MDLSTKYLLTIVLDEACRGQGKTRHFREGMDVTGQVAEVRLATIEGDSGVYIFYYDIDGNELNDLYYESLERARQHIEWEFGLKGLSCS